MKVRVGQLHLGRKAVLAVARMAALQIGFSAPQATDIFQSAANDAP